MLQLGPAQMPGVGRRRSRLLKRTEVASIGPGSNAGSGVPLDSQSSLDAVASIGPGSNAGSGVRIEMISHYVRRQNRRDGMG